VRVQILYQLHITFDIQTTSSTEEVGAEKRNHITAVKTT